MTDCYLGLGSNIGDRERLLRQAVAYIDRVPEIAVVHCSSIYETEPVGYTNQSAFLNAVIRIKTRLSPTDLLASCMDIEQQLQRERLVKWGPRTIDIDILLYDDLQISTPVLSIPHPLMGERFFVLIPLAEINPHLTWYGETVEQYIDKLGEQQGITCYKLW
jgi:2-amino-4-hydroxy-6-hydroxymethyldihydropteridine diphosphokinase